MSSKGDDKLWVTRFKFRVGVSCMFSSKKISCYFISKNYSPNSYLGFRKGTAVKVYTLLIMIEDWKSSLDNGNNVGTIAVDLSKAFDSLPHGLLVAKRFASGVTLSVCKLLCSYIHNNHQRVKNKWRKKRLVEHWKRCSPGVNTWPPHRKWC